MSKRRVNDNSFEDKVCDRVKQRLIKEFRADSVHSYTAGNLVSMPAFVIDELSEEFVNNLGRRVLAQLNAQPLDTKTRRNMKSQLNEMLATMKKDLKSSAKSHLDKFFEIY